VVILHQLPSQGFLILRGLITHIEHGFSRPDILLGVAMTPETPFHEQGGDLVGERHFVDLPVTGRAADSFLDVDVVVEIDEARQVVNPFPANRLVGSIAF
jgi:hypothetical protein